MDTSAWIAYFRLQGFEGLKHEVQEALAKGRLYTCWVVRAEVLVGARDEAGFARLERILRALPEVALDAAVWAGAARLGYRLRRAGLSLPLPDLLIAQAALVADIELWHLDAHYETIAQHCPLRTRSFLDS